MQCNGECNVVKTQSTCCHDIIDFLTLIDLANLKEIVGTNVLLIVREPNGLEAYQLSSAFTVSANSDKWVNTSQRLANSAYACFII